jgi:aldehyde dehydrogenase (NAD+)
MAYKEELGPILENQRKFFASGKTLDIDYRLGNLKKLRSLILSHEDELNNALQKDFHKPYFEVLGTESRFTVAEISLMIRNLKKWSGRQRVRTSLANIPARSDILPQPYGQVLILSAWNYSIQLSMIPAMSALAVGKKVMIKAAENLTPITLELGGKNPCVIAADAKLGYADRIAAPAFRGYRSQRNGKIC